MYALVLIRTYLCVGLLLPGRHLLRSALSIRNRRYRLEYAQLPLLCGLFAGGLNLFRRILLAHVGGEGFSEPRHGAFEVRHAERDTGHSISGKRIPLR